MYYVATSVDGYIADEKHALDCVEDAVAAGARIVYPVEDQDYGWRLGCVADPFGHLWEIGKPLAGLDHTA